MGSAVAWGYFHGLGAYSIITEINSVLHDPMPTSYHSNTNLLSVDLYFLRSDGV